MSSDLHTDNIPTYVHKYRHSDWQTEILTDWQITQANLHIVGQKCTKKYWNIYSDRHMRTKDRTDKRMNVRRRSCNGDKFIISIIVIWMILCAVYFSVCLYIFIFSSVLPKTAHIGVGLDERSMYVMSSPIGWTLW